MQRVYLARDPADAHLVAGYLEDNGIKVGIQGELLEGGFGELPAMGIEPEVWVQNDSDAARALELVAEMEARRKHRRPE